MNNASLQVNTTAWIDTEQRRAAEAEQTMAKELRQLEDVELALVGGGDGTPCW